MEKIVLRDVTKVIKHNTVLDGVNLELEKGGIYGFVGANGSGKTMLFRAICGLIGTQGDVTVFSEQIGKDASFPKSLGVLIESVGFWPEYTGFSNLKMLASIKKLIGDDDIKESISRVGLEPNDKRTYKKYSLGMKQRLGIAQAIMEKPELLILDEPTNALDEDGVKLVHDIIQKERDRGATVLLASHNRDEINSLCDRIFKMAGGKISEVKDGEHIED